MAAPGDDDTKSDIDTREFTEECPICFTEADQNRLLGCKNGHFTCLDCSRRMVHPCTSACAIKHCVGFVHKCAVCRAVGALNPPQLLAIMSGSWKIACEMHSSDEEMYRWKDRTARARHGCVDASA